MVIPFLELLGRHLQSRHMQQGEFAQRVGISEAFVSQILSGVRRPKFERGEQWCDALRLTGAEREDFLDAMAIAASPPRVSTIVARFEQKLKQRDG